MTEIKAALTAEEWAAWLNEDDANGLGHGRYELHHQPDVNTHEVRRYSDGIVCTTGEYVGEEFSPDERDQHAIAALALYGQPFGFTAEDVDLLRGAAVALEARMDRWNLLETEQPPALRALADRIAALLPE